MIKLLYEFSGLTLSGALTSVDNTTPLNFSLKDNVSNAASFGSTNMSKLLSFDTTANEEKLVTNAARYVLL